MSEYIYTQYHNVLMVVYAYNPNSNSNPWIYGLYEDHQEGLSKMREMENREEYKHLIWNNCLKQIK